MALKRIIVNGIVQGVNFRYNVTKEAMRLNLAGTIENLPDYSVEIIVSGGSSGIEKLVNWLKGSPGHSQVENICMDDVENNIKYNDFKIIF